MRLNVKKLAKESNNQNILIVIDERLPSHLSKACKLNVDCKSRLYDDYYLLELKTHGQLTVCCQRCMNEFNTVYENALTLAVCTTESRAEQLLSTYECIVAPDYMIDLKQIITDELHLYSAYFHPDSMECTKSYPPHVD